MPDDPWARVGNVVSNRYRHVSKRVSPGPPFAVPDVFLKWYALCREDQSIDPAGTEEAHAFLAGEITDGRLPIAGDLGFAIHHRSGDDVHLLLVCTWRDDNEMWETVYVKDVRQDQAFNLMPQTTHRGVMCVWEFGAVAHEHRAWTRYLRSARSSSDKRTYAEDMFEGVV